MLIALNFIHYAVTRQRTTTMSVYSQFNNYFGSRNYGEKMGISLKSSVCSSRKDVFFLEMVAEKLELYFYFTSLKVAYTDYYIKTNDYFVRFERGLGDINQLTKI